MARSSRHRTTRTARRHLIRHIAIGVLSFLILSVVGTGVWYGTRLASVTIDEVRVSGGDTISPERVRGVVEQTLDGSYVLLIPHRFTFFYPHDLIKERVSAMPRIADVAISRNGRTLDVSFTEYVPAMVWCDADETVCMLTDKDGFAYTTAPSLSGSQLTRYIDTQRVPERGRTALTTDVINDIQVLTDALSREYGWDTNVVRRTSDESFSLTFAGGHAVRVSSAIPVADVFGRIETLLTSDEFQHLTNGDFVYIDLRYGNRVFVREEEVATTTASTTAAEFEE